MTRTAWMTDAQSTLSGLYVLPATVPLILATCKQKTSFGAQHTGQAHIGNAHVDSAQEPKVHVQEC